jgi:hypothetical protein
VVRFFSAPGHPAIKNSGHVLPDLINLMSLRYWMASTLKRLNLTQAANQSRSHPSMSVTWNLVSDRARRIPARFFKIHKRNARAMKFKRTAATEQGVTSAETLSIPEPFCPTC